MGQILNVFIQVAPRYTLLTLLTLFLLFAFDTVDMVYTVDTIGIVYTIDMVYNGLPLSLVMFRWEL